MRHSKLSRRGESPGGIGALDIVNKCPFAEPADAGIRVQLNALCTIGVANVRYATAGAGVHIADDMLEPAEASALVRVLLARLEGMVSSRLLEKTNVVRNFKHLASLLLWGSKPVF